MATNFQPKQWQMNPDNLTTKTVQYWNDNGIMVTAMMPLEKAKEQVRLGRAFIISEQAINFWDGEPMVDQPQPPSEIEPQSFKVGDLVYYVNAHNHTCTATVMNVTSDVVTILTSAGGKLERPASDLQMVTGSYNDDYSHTDAVELTLDDLVDCDDLPFTDIGNDPDDTQELPTVKVEAEMSLSQLVDAALDPDNTEAFETLKAYDLTNVPLWVLEIERNDVADLKWALWSECRKINAGTLMSNPDYVAKQIEVNRAFQVCDILHKEVVNRKAVGFNVEN